MLWDQDFYPDLGQVYAGVSVVDRDVVSVLAVVRSHSPVPWLRGLKCRDTCLQSKMKWVRVPPEPPMVVWQIGNAAVCKTAWETSVGSIPTTTSIIVFLSGLGLCWADGTTG